MQKRVAVCFLSLVLLVSATAPAPAGGATSVSVTGTTPATTAGGAGAWFAGGIIATAAALCIYDIWLKFLGWKNWDGTPKVVHVHHHHH